MKQLLKLRYILVSFAGLILIWYLIAQFSSVGEALLPKPLTVGKALVDLFADGTMGANIGASLYRFAVGYFIAVVAGAALGLVIGWLRPLYGYLSPILQVIRPIAPVAWMPFVVLFIGIGDVPAIAIIFLAGFFPVLLSTISAVRNIDPVYLKVAKNFGIKQPAVLYKIVFPAVFPQIANSLHVALGSAWIFLVSGEMVGAQSGLGYMIIDARNNLRMDHLLAAVAVIGVIGFLLDALIGKFERSVMKAWGKA